MAQRLRSRFGRVQDRDCRNSAANRTLRPRRRSLTPATRETAMGRKAAGRRATDRVAAPTAAPLPAPLAGGAANADDAKGGAWYRERPAWLAAAAAIDRTWGDLRRPGPANEQVQKPKAPSVAGGAFGSRNVIYASSTATSTTTGTRAVGPDDRKNSVVLLHARDLPQFPAAVNAATGPRNGLRRIVTFRQQDFTAPRPGSGAAGHPARPWRDA